MAARLMDDGQRPVLDLHGCTIDQALALTRALIVESVKRGRDSIELIHGRSTSDALGHNRTIKNELYRQLDDGMMRTHVSQCLKRDSSMVVALRRQARQTDRRRISLREITRA